ncbi:hypothetical protein Y032_0154g2973 [Ancylostoma ceylanicum]|uniref:Uncharacterized protein n=1 Tax=Ancylostoma ceylanicum TaxID=53326 RepID=A0A016T026_9BILA|nr:hypothetical protein Y032_0154g2973 [Ancylostoma ceylanicum]
MVAGKRGRPRKVTLPAGDPAKEPKTLTVAKTEPQDGQGPSNSKGQSSSYVPAEGEVVRGYDEEPEEEDAVIDVVGEDTTVERTTHEIFEPSPIERRLRESRTFNEGDWSSTELKALYDGITTYGTTEAALDVIQTNFCGTRTLEQVIAKVEEIRGLIAEHREDRVAMQSEQWINTGYRDVRVVPQYFMPPEVNNWEAAIQRVNRQIRSHSDYPLRAAIELLVPRRSKAADFPGYIGVLYPWG